MSIATVFAYWMGQRKAISQIVATENALWLGLLFVLSAGFAREYDGEDLLSEPWHLLLPLVASVLLSLALFALVAKLAPWNEAVSKKLLDRYLVFLRMFWMTAPIAWLYAVPVEHFLSAENATRANLWLLAIVSTWRVVLMVRVVSILTGVRTAWAAMPVLFFADTVALVALWFAPLPVFSIMGGIRLTESEQLIQNVSFTVGFFGTISWPVWLIGTCAAYFAHRRSRTPATPREPVKSEASLGGVSSGLWLLAGCSLAVWVFVLPVTQPAQQLRHNVESALESGEIHQALATMSEHDRSDFPPHWEPPPRIGYGETKPDLLVILEGACVGDTSAWVADIFLEKLAQRVHEFAPFSFWQQTRGDEFDRYLDVLQTLPGGIEIVRKVPNALEHRLADDKCTPSQREKILMILAAAGHEVEEERASGEQADE